VNNCVVFSSQLSLKILHSIKSDLETDLNKQSLLEKICQIRVSLKELFRLLPTKDLSGFKQATQFYFIFGI